MMNWGSTHAQWIICSATISFIKGLPNPVNVLHSQSELGTKKSEETKVKSWRDERHLSLTLNVTELTDLNGYDIIPTCGQ